MLIPDQRMARRRILLWSSSILNLCILAIAIWYQSDVMIWISCSCSVLLIFIQKKYRNDLKEEVANTFKRYEGIAKNEWKKKRVGRSENAAVFKFENTSLLTGIANSDTVKVGSSQCSNPFEMPVLNLDNNSLQGSSTALDIASWSENFIYTEKLGETKLKHAGPGRRILQLSVNSSSLFSFNNGDQLTLLKGVSNSSSVCGIELVLSTDNNQPYLLSELIRSADYNYFDNSEKLLRFVSQVRDISGGKPIGIRTGIGANIDLLELCVWMKKTGVYLDFITVIGKDKGYLSTVLKYIMSLEHAVSFVQRIFVQYHLENEIRILAAGKIDNGLQLAKTMSCGADACISTRTVQSVFEKIEQYNCEDPEGLFYNNLVSIYRKIINDFLRLTGSETELPGHFDYHGPVQNFTKTQILKNIMYHLN